MVLSNDKTLLEKLIMAKRKTTSNDPTSWQVSFVHTDKVASRRILLILFVIITSDFLKLIDPTSSTSVSLSDSSHNETNDLNDSTIQTFSENKLKKEVDDDDNERNEIEDYKRRNSNLTNLMKVMDDTSISAENRRHIFELIRNDTVTLTSSKRNIVIQSDTILLKKVLDKIHGKMNVSFEGESKRDSSFQWRIMFNDTTVLVVKTADNYYYWTYAQTASALVIFSMIVVGNLSILHRLKSCRRRRSNVNYFIVQLAIADLLVGIFSITLDSLLRLQVAFTYGLFACRASKYISDLFIYSSTNLLVALSIDRWEAVVKPLAFTRNRSRGYHLVIGAWLLAILFASPVALFSTIKEIDGQPQCWIDLTQTGWRVYVVYLVCLLLIVPTIIIAICYTHIVYTIWSKARLVSDQRKNLEQGQKDRQLNRRQQDDRENIRSRDDIINDDCNRRIITLNLSDENNNNNDNTKSTLNIVGLTQSACIKSASFRETNSDTNKQLDNNNNIEIVRQKTQQTIRKTELGSNKSAGDGKIVTNKREARKNKNNSGRLDYGADGEIISRHHDDGSTSSLSSSSSDATYIASSTSSCKEISPSSKKKKRKKNNTNIRHQMARLAKKDGLNSSRQVTPIELKAPDVVKHGRPPPPPPDDGHVRRITRSPTTPSPSSTSLSSTSLDLIVYKGESETTRAATNDGLGSEFRETKTSTEGSKMETKKTKVQQKLQHSKSKHRPEGSKKMTSFAPLDRRRTLSGPPETTTRPATIASNTTTAPAATMTTTTVGKERDLDYVPQQHGSGVIPKARIKTIKMTLVIVVAYILCWSPFCILNICSVFGLMRNNTNVSQALMTLTQSLAHLNSAVNPIIFWLFSSRRHQSNQAASSGVANGHSVGGKRLSGGRRLLQFASSTSRNQISLTGKQQKHLQQLPEQQLSTNQLIGPKTIRPFFQRIFSASSEH